MGEIADNHAVEGVRDESLAEMKVSVQQLRQDLSRLSRLQTAPAVQTSIADATSDPRAARVRQLVCNTLPLRDGVAQFQPVFNNPLNRIPEVGDQPRLLDVERHSNRPWTAGTSSRLSGSMKHEFSALMSMKSYTCDLQESMRTVLQATAGANANLVSGEEWRDLLSRTLQGVDLLMRETLENRLQLIEFLADPELKPHAKQYAVTRYNDMVRDHEWSDKTLRQHVAAYQELCNEYWIKQMAKQDAIQSFERRQSKNRRRRSRRKRSAQPSEPVDEQPNGLLADDDSESDCDALTL